MMIDRELVFDDRAEKVERRRPLIDATYREKKRIYRLYRKDV